MALVASKPLGGSEPSRAQEKGLHGLTDWPRVAELLSTLEAPRTLAQEIPQKGEIVAPLLGQLRSMSLAELRETITLNHASLAQTLDAVRDILPVLGFHGRIRAKLDEMIETRNCTNREGRNVGTQVTTFVRKDENPTALAADLYAAVGYTFAYANPTELASKGVSYEPGGIVVVRMRTLPGLDRVLGVEVRQAQALDMGLEGESRHFGTAAIFISPETYSEVVLGVIPHSKYGYIEALRAEIGGLGIDAENYEKLLCLRILQEQVVVREALTIAGVIEPHGSSKVSEISRDQGVVEPAHTRGRPRVRL